MKMPGTLQVAWYDGSLSLRGVALTGAARLCHTSGPVTDPPGYAATTSFVRGASMYLQKGMALFLGELYRC